MLVGLVLSALAFSPSGMLPAAQQRSASLQQRRSIMAEKNPAAKGFGKVPAAQKPQPKKPKSAASVQRDQAATDFDNLRASGAPEYMILVRTVAEGEEPSKWYPVGGMAIPRSSSEDQALSIAIFENEDALLKGAFRSYPFLKDSTDRFVYGFRLKEFTDDPIKVASKELVEAASNPIAQWYALTQHGRRHASCLCPPRSCVRLCPSCT
jgi:hypothetical protein